MPITKATASAVAPAAKGDLVVGSATNDAAVLGVGSANQVLTVDSSTTTGLKWAAAGGADPFMVGLVTNNYYTAYTAVNKLESNVDQQYTYYLPVYIYGGTYDRIAFRTTASFGGTHPVRLGIYELNSTTKLPGNLLLDAGQVSATAGSTLYTITINQTLTSGYYYLAFNDQKTVDNYDAYYLMWDTPNWVNNVGWTSTDLSNNPGQHFRREGVISGAFANAGTTAAIAKCPVIGLRRT